MSGRHRRRERRPRWLPALGVVAGITLGGATYATVLLSSPVASSPRLPATGEPGMPPGQLDRTARVVQVLEGDAFVIEGGATVRVLAADSCEIRTDAGPVARTDAARVLDGATVALRREPSGTNDVDRDGRLLRYVDVQGVGDLGSMMVQRQHTAVYRGFNDATAAYADRLRTLDRDGRRCADTLPSASPHVRYPDCAAAEAAGTAPLYAGDPPYGREIDGNDDGVACE